MGRPRSRGRLASTRLSFPTRWSRPRCHPVASSHPPSMVRKALASLVASFRALATAEGVHRSAGVQIAVGGSMIAVSFSGRKPGRRCGQSQWGGNHTWHARPAPGRPYREPFTASVSARPPPAGRRAAGLARGSARRGRPRYPRGDCAPGGHRLPDRQRRGIPAP